MNAAGALRPRTVRSNHDHHPEHQPEPPGRRTPSTEAPDLDVARVEEFAGKVLQIISDAAAALVAQHRAPHWALRQMADLPPSTSRQVADATGLQERYVREWLAAMLVGGIVEHDPATGTWWLPPEHGAVLTRRAGKDNLAKLAQFVGLMASVEQQVVTCFREGGGVPYSAYTEFHALMAEDSKDMAEALLVDDVVPLVDGLADRLSRGISVADVGCGSGHHLNVLASTYPASSFVGYDFSEEAIASARATAESRGLTNVRFEVRDVSDLSGTGPFDFVTAFDAIHDQAHPAAVLAGIAGVPRTGRRVPDVRHPRLQPSPRERRCAGRRLPLRRLATGGWSSRPSRSRAGA